MSKTPQHFIQKGFDKANVLARDYFSQKEKLHKLVCAYAELLYLHRQRFIVTLDPRWEILNTLIAKNVPKGTDGVIVRQQIKEGAAKMLDMAFPESSATHGRSSYAESQTLIQDLTEETKTWDPSWRIDDAEGNPVAGPT